MQAAEVHFIHSDCPYQSTSCTFKINTSRTGQESWKKDLHNIKSSKSGISFHCLLCRNTQSQFAHVQEVPIAAPEPKVRIWSSYSKLKKGMIRDTEDSISQCCHWLSYQRQACLYFLIFCFVRETDFSACYPWISNTVPVPYLCASPLPTELTCTCILHFQYNEMIASDFFFFFALNCKVSPINFAVNGLSPDCEKTIWLVNLSPFKQTTPELLLPAWWDHSEHLPQILPKKNTKPNFCPVRTKTCKIYKLFGHMLECEDLEKESCEWWINFEKKKKKQQSWKWKWWMESWLKWEDGGKIHAERCHTLQIVKEWHKWLRKYIDRKKRKLTEI